MTHTPGPWMLQGNGIVKDPVTGSSVATQRIETAEGWGMIDLIDGTNEQSGNAQLIVCAPEMLQVLETIYANAAESAEWIRNRIGPLIAKARGGE